MIFFKLVETKQLYKEKWIEKNGTHVILKSISLSKESSDIELFLDPKKANRVKSYLVKSLAPEIHKNKKTEIIGKIKTGVDEVLYTTWNVEEIEVSKTNVTKFANGDLRVFDGQRSFVVKCDAVFEK